MNKFMKLGFDQARKGFLNNEGGPFGATIVDSKGNVIAVGNNRVLIDHDPTAHAEVTAIRMAAKELGTHDLTGCTIYSTCQPCPMCLSAIIWSNIKVVYYGGTDTDAAAIGFRDELIYQVLRNEKQVLDIKKMEEERKECQKIFAEYANLQKTIY